MLLANQFQPYLSNHLARPGSSNFIHLIPGKIIIWLLYVGYKIVAQIKEKQNVFKQKKYNVNLWFVEWMRNSDFKQFWVHTVLKSHEVKKTRSNNIESTLVLIMVEDH